MEPEKTPTEKPEREIVPVFPDPEKTAFQAGYRSGVRDIIYVMSVSVIMAALLLRLSKENF